MALNTPSANSNKDPKNELSDDRIKSLVADAQKGNQAAFSQLYDAYFDKIFKYIYYRVNHKEIAEDLTEEVFIKTWTRIGTVKPDSFGGWIYSVAKNTIIDYYRSKKQVVDLEEVENVLESDENISDNTNTVMERQLFMQVLKQLTPEQQIIVKLKFLEGLENSEISELISKSEGAIRVIQHRAVAKLQELIKQHVQTQADINRESK